MHSTRPAPGFNILRTMSSVTRKQANFLFKEVFPPPYNKKKISRMPAPFHKSAHASKHATCVVYTPGTGLHFDRQKACAVTNQRAGKPSSLYVYTPFFLRKSPGNVHRTKPFFSSVQRDSTCKACIVLKGTSRRLSNASGVLEDWRSPDSNEFSLFTDPNCLA